MNNIKQWIQKFNKPLMKKALFFVLLFFVILICYEFFYGAARVGTDNLQTIRTLMIIIPIICFGYGCYLKGKGKLNIETFCLLIMLAGFSLRIGYAFYTGVNTRQHDVEMFDGSKLNLDGHGHFSYIYTIFSTGRLPSTIEWQFYHPPLWHATVALFMKIMQIFHPTADVEALFNESIVVASYVGCLTLYGFKELLFTIFNKTKEDLGFKNKNNIMLAVAFTLLAFHSQFFIMSGWMNNEGMAFMFMVFALLYGIKFHLDRKWSDIILCALMLSFGATTKVSVALICIPLGLLFVYDLVIELKNKHFNILAKAGAFVGICLPISTWFVIRNIIKFHEPAIGVPGIDPYKSPLGVIKYSYWQRFGIPDLFKGFSESIFCILRPNEHGYMDYNVWTYTFKCSVFGEYNYWQGDIFANGLLFFNVLIILLSVFCLIYDFVISFKKKDEDKRYKMINYSMHVIFIVSIISYIVFQILYPVTCTQDFRYMTLILLPGTYFVAKYLINSKNKVMKTITMLLVVGFCSFSFLYFISCR